MSFKSGATEILGRKITGVIVNSQPLGVIPKFQVWLTFDDGSAYEIYGEDIHFSSGIVPYSFEKISDVPERVETLFSAGC